MSLSGFTSPWWLLLLFVVAALGGAYVLVQRRRQTNTLRFTNLELLEKVAPARPGRARHLPVALLLVGLVFLTVALAGPTAEQRVPRNRATVVLVIAQPLTALITVAYLGGIMAILYWVVSGKSVQAGRVSLM